MSQKLQEFYFADNYPIKSASQMTLAEMSKWFALCNALKFINHTSQLTGVDVLERDIDYRAVLHYIESVGGDIETCLKKNRGIPYKYSLDISLDDSLDLTEVSYDYIA